MRVIQILPRYRGLLPHRPIFCRRAVTGSALPCAYRLPSPSGPCSRWPPSSCSVASRWRCRRRRMTHSRASRRASNRAIRPLCSWTRRRVWRWSCSGRGDVPASAGRPRPPRLFPPVPARPRRFPRALVERRGADGDRQLLDGGRWGPAQRSRPAPPGRRGVGTRFHPDRPLVDGPNGGALEQPVQGRVLA